MRRWNERLPIDPLPVLSTCEDESLAYWVGRDLRDQPACPVQAVWESTAAKRILSKQQEDGSWRYPGQNRARFPEVNYDLLETFRVLAKLVQCHAFDRRHSAVEAAAEYLFSCQTEEGDLRGILGTQYMPYYHALIMELLIEAGYHHDPRVLRGLEWLLSMRQEDGGWIIPLQAVAPKEKTREMWSAPPIPPDRQRPHSHLATGMVLRAFAVHPQYAELPEVRAAAEVLKARFFKSDAYNDRKTPAYWTKFQYPFWWNNLLTALDSLSRIGFSACDEDVQEGLAWFKANQEQDGLWKTGYEQAKRERMSAKEEEARLWVGLAVCRVFRRSYAEGVA